jgi:hypothetical protein
MVGTPSLDALERQNAHIDLGEALTKLVQDLGKVQPSLKIDLIQHFTKRGARSYDAFKPAAAFSWITLRVQQLIECNVRLEIGCCPGQRGRAGAAP